MITTGSYSGMSPLEIYDYPIMIVPAANAKTLNPDQQLTRAEAAWTFVKEHLVPMGVVVDPQEAAMDILSHWDPITASKWIKNPQENGPQGQQPVYKTLETLQGQVQQQTEMLQSLRDVAEKVATLAEQNSQRLDQQPPPQAAAPPQPGVAVA
jgi:hypothetical protein